MRGGGAQEVEGGAETPLFSRERPMLGEGFHDRLGQVDDGLAVKETPKGLHPHPRIGEEERALEQFRPG